MIKVYVAGSYSANNVLDVLKNIGRGERLAADIFKLGFAPFCPWHDKDFIIKNPDTDFTVDQFYKYSIEWLKVSDCILLAEGWENSKGTIEEINIAEKMDMPVFDSVHKLVKYWKEKK